MRCLRMERQIEKFLGSCFVILDSDLKKFKNLILICIILILLSASRSQIPIMPLIALAIFGYSLDNSYKKIIGFKSLPVLIFFSSFLLASSYSIFLQLQTSDNLEGNNLITRSAEVVSLQNLTIFFDLISDDFLATSKGSIEGGSSWYVDYGSHPDADDSFLIRAYKWTSVLSILSNNSHYLIYGLGPGSLGDALDGGILRSISEYGLFFIIYYVIIFNRIFRYNSWIIMMIFFLPTMLLIDIHLSSKVQPLILAMAFYAGKFKYNEITSS